MEELLVRAPQAHEHMTRVPDEDTQEALGGALLKLTHEGLVHVDEGLEMDTTTHVPPAEHTPEQQELHSGVNDILADVARCTAQATERLDDESGSKYDIYVSHQERLLGGAKKVALGEVIQAKEAGDDETVARGIKTVLAIGLLQSAERHGDTTEVPELVAHGLAKEVITALDETRGLIAIEDGSWDRPVDSANRLKTHANLLQVASGLELDDQLQPAGNFQPGGITPESSQRRKELLESLDHTQLMALARDARDNKRNEDQARFLAEAAMDKLTQPGSYSHREEDKQAADTIGQASDILLASQDPEVQEKFRENLHVLRTLRCAGLKPYRVNTSISGTLDKAIIRLVMDGKDDAARELMSASAHELFYGDQESKEKYHFNLDGALDVFTFATDDERTAVRDRLETLHRERLTAFNRALTERGLNQESIKAFIQNAGDPESALDTDPAFWPQYNKLIGRNVDGSFIDRAHMEASPAYGMMKILEQGQSFDIGSKTQAMQLMLSVGREPSEIGDRLLQNLQEIKDVDQQRQYLEELSEVSVAIAKIAAENPDMYLRQDNVIALLEQFDHPSLAMQALLKLQGTDGLAAANRGLLDTFYKPYSPLEGLIPVTQEQIDKITLFTDGLPMTGIGKFPDFLRDELFSMSIEELQAIVDAVAAHPELASVMTRETVHVEKFLAAGDPQERSALLAAAVTETGFSEALQKVPIQESTRSFMLSNIFNDPEQLQERMAVMTRAISADGLGEFITKHPDFDRQIIVSLVQFSIRESRIDELKQALELEGLEGMLGENAEQNASQLLSAIIGDRDPVARSQEALELHTALGFLREAGIETPYAAHMEQWVEFSRALPEGGEGTRVRRQVIARLQLEISEDPSQAIRIFSELTPPNSESQAAYQAGLRLIERLAASEDTRGFPSAKPTKIGEIFKDQTLAALYTQVLALKQAGDTAGLQELVQLHDLSLDGGPDEPELTDAVQQLKTSVEGLNEHDRRAKQWIREYSGQTIKAAKLIEAWNARAFALSRGVDDNPNDILRWVAEQGNLAYAFEKIGLGETDITAEEAEAQEPWIKAMGSRYAPQTTLEAIERRVHFLREHGSTPTKQIPAGTTSVTTDDRLFRAEILDKDDPRGLFIGYDTGCCMTLKGYSEDCIWAGYEDPRYSFFAVYDDAGKIRAQSIMYVATVDDKTILVADNIEANEGTDLTVIADVYRDALVKIAEENGTRFDAIHIGVGFTQDEILKDLKDATVSPQSPLPIYTDAAKQKVLWSRESTG